MKKNNIIYILYLILLLLVLSGCHKNELAGNTLGTTDEAVASWEGSSTLTYGQAKTETLQTAAWNSGRSESTSYNTLAETENGYYFMFSSWLYYADKSDLSNWVVLCNKPACAHTDERCKGKIYSNAFCIREQKLYRTGNTAFYHQLYQGKGQGALFIESNLVGEDTQIAYVPEYAVTTSNVAGADCFLGDQWVFFAVDLDNAGITHVRGISVSEEGTRIFWEQEGDITSLSLMGAKNMFSIYGDKYFCCSLLDSTNAKIYRVEDGTLAEIDVSGLPVKGSYLSGQTLRCFRQNDGYYDIDLNEKEEKRLMDARLKNSYCTAILPNCIVESTLLYPESVDGRISGMQHSMEIFDGESWHTVELPLELKNAAKNTYLSVRAVTSDGIWLSRLEQVRVMKDNIPQVYVDMVLYRIPIGQDSWYLEYIGTVKTPRM